MNFVPTYPVFEVLNLDGQPISVVIWQVRAIYDATARRQKVTRIEYANGDTLDTAEESTEVLDKFYAAAIH